MKETVTVDDVIEVLNRALEKDPGVVFSLVSNRVACNEVLANDESIQVGVCGSDEGTNHYEVGLLGIVNGFFGVDDKGSGPIVAVFEVAEEDRDKELGIVKFQRRE